MKNRYYIENLTVYSWLFYILPHFLEGRLEVLQETKEIYYFNNSRLGLLLASLTLWFVKVRLKRVNFSQGDMRDQDSNLIWMKTMGDALSIQDDIKNNPEFQKVVRNYGVINRMQSFLTRCVIFCDLAARDTSSMLKLIFLFELLIVGKVLMTLLRLLVEICFFLYERGHGWLSLRSLLKRKK